LSLTLVFAFVCAMSPPLLYDAFRRGAPAARLRRT
jgi:hypothetical protein